MTQSDLAGELGVTPPAVCYWESGENIPNPDKVEKIAKFLDVSVEWLFDPSPLDFHSTGVRPPGKNAKYWIREIFDELSDEFIVARRDDSR